MGKIVLLFAALLSVFHAGQSLKCYICDLSTNPSCTVPLSGSVPSGECGIDYITTNRAISGDSLTRNLPQDFDGHEGLTRSSDYHCITISATNLISGNTNYTSALHSCAMRSLTCALATVELKNKGFQTIQCSSCTSDLCNGANTSIAFSWVTLLLPLLAVSTRMW